MSDKEGENCWTCEFAVENAAESFGCFPCKKTGETIPVEFLEEHTMFACKYYKKRRGKKK